ncbi:uncharacterized protein [Macrobrachium rosenbergii]|uniref:uncharacterized protein n=1 Tax=Macrobrachium rosenbergii TaxID=79674 RepID=UPI0034D5D9F2
MSMAKKCLKRLPRVCILQPGAILMYMNLTLHLQSYVLYQHLCLFILDSTTDTHLLVDTGACCPLLPVSSQPTKRQQPSHVRLTAVNGSPILTFGEGFLVHHQLDVANRHLVDATDLSTTPSAATPTENWPSMSPIPKPILHTYSPNTQIFSNLNCGNLIKSLPSTVFSTSLRPQALLYTLISDAYHLKNLPLQRKLLLRWRRWVCVKRYPVLGHLPPNIVTKKDGTLRPCGDYRKLNMITKADHYPLPNITEVNTFLHGAKIFSKLDFLKGYFQVPMNLEDIPKSAITTPFSTFTFNYSCFGIHNAGATFQRLMGGIMGDLPFCICCVDDILIFSSSKGEHLQHLHIILQCLQENGLIIQYNKCSFTTKRVEFLGHLITPEGVQPFPKKVAAIRSPPPPLSRVYKNSTEW